MSDESFEVIFETTIRYVRPKKKDIDVVDTVLYALSVDEVGARIYKYLREREMATPEEISEKLSLPIEEVLDKLDYLYSIGLIDKLGKAYVCNMPLSKAIRRRTSRRIIDILNHLADLLEGGGDEG